MRHFTRFYPRLQVDTTICSAVGQAGGALLTETVQASGVGAALSTGLARWRQPTAIHDPAKIIVDSRGDVGVGWGLPR